MLKMILYLSPDLKTSMMDPTWQKKISYNNSNNICRSGPLLPAYAVKNFPSDIALNKKTIIFLIPRKRLLWVPLEATARHF